MIISNIPQQFNVFSFTFHVYGLILGISGVIAILFFDKKTKSHFHPADYILVILSAVVGGRLLYIINSLSTRAFSFQDIFSINTGGIALHGVLIGTALGIWIISKIKKIKFFDVTDILVIILPVSQAFGRLGNFVNNELYGKPTTLPWKLYIPPEKRLPGYQNYQYFHPVFLYEMILDIVNFFIIFSVSKLPSRYKIAHQPGILTALYLINYGIIRLLMNTVRIDKAYIFGVETSSFFSIIMIIFGLIIFIHNLNSTKSSKFQE